jgi:hypothetical protein
MMGSLALVPRFLPMRSSVIPRALPSVTRIARFGRQFSQRHMMSTSRSSNEPLALGTMLKTDYERTYKIEEILADRRKPLLCVYRARCVD